MIYVQSLYFGIFLEGDGLGEGYGMLGQAGSGKLRVSAGQSRLAAKVAKKYDYDPMLLFCFSYLCHSFSEMPRISVFIDAILYFSDLRKEVTEAVEQLLV